MKISRPCYGQPHRCPGWAGGGTRPARTRRCDNGRIYAVYAYPLWQLRGQRCGGCRTWILPYAVRWVDWRWLRSRYRARRRGEKTKIGEHI